MLNLNTVLQRLLGGDTPPNKVIEIKIETLGKSNALLRDDAMVLYAPAYNSNPNGNEDKKYEIILQRLCSDPNTTSFSLYRSPNQAEVEEKFNAYIHRLPVFVNIVKEFYNVAGLQKICDALSQHPSWSLTHLIAYFNLIDHVGNPKVLEFLDYPDHENCMTPLQLAIKCNNLEMVKALIPLCKLEHLDNSNNSVYHYAASTTKEIINIIGTKTNKHLNKFNNDGFTPLHLACQSDKPDCVKALLIAGADPNLAAQNNNKNYKSATPTSVADFFKTNANKLYIQDMKYGGTPLHWCSSKETLQALIERGCDINAQNFEGRTALHVMVARNRLDCVVTLLAHDVELDVIDQDGNTPLHIAVEKKLIPIVQSLVVFGCDMGLLNKEGHTPRHLVGKESPGSTESEILYILHSVGAERCPESNIDCPTGCHANGTYNGIPPVAPESAEQRPEIQEMLATTSRGQSNNSNPIDPKNISEFPPTTSIIDTSIEQKGQSVMDALLGMFTSKVVKTEGVGTPEIESPKSESSDSNPKPETRGGRLLCLDGGGIRGLVLIQLLLEIERLSQTPILHLFDWVSGTSTGGILALGIGCGKTMRQCMGIYFRMKEYCFVGSRPYPSESLEQVLKDNLGEFTVMTDITYPKIMVCGVMADRKPVDLHIFRNYTSPSDLLGIITPDNNRRVPPPKPEDQLVWRAGRATGAAPSYFRAYGRFLDGGLIANNPTLDALTEIHEYNMALRSIGKQNEAKNVSIVCSLGTGLVPVTELKDIDVFRPESLWDTAKLAYGISAIGNLLVDQATASDGRVVDRARAWCSMIGVPYYRFNPQLTEEIAMDEKSDQKIINMLWHTKAYVFSNQKKIMEMISLLK